MTNPPDSAGQLELFTEYQLGPAHLSRVIPAWDILGIFLISRRNEVPPDTPAANILPRKHEFQQGSETIGFEVRPALLTAKGGRTSRVIFAGEREQLVAAAIRALAVRGEAVLGKTPGKNAESWHVTVAFTVRQLRAELESTRHTFSHAEVMEALDILGKTLVTITRTRAHTDDQPISDDFSYYTNHMAQGDKRIVVLNAFESQLILAGAYRALNYARFMSLDDPLARWLYQYIHTEHRGARKPKPDQKPVPFWFTLDQLLERGVLQPTKELRKTIQRVRNMLTLLAEKMVLDRNADESAPAGYLEELTHQATGGRRKIVGARWGVFISVREVDDIIDENSEAMTRNDAFIKYPLRERLRIAKQPRENLARKKPDLELANPSRKRKV